MCKKIKIGTSTGVKKDRVNREETSKIMNKKYAALKRRKKVSTFRIET